MVAISFRKLTALVTLFAATVAQNASGPLVNFQVSEPLTLPKDVTKCEVQLIHRVFGNSYYQPEIVQYACVMFNHSTGFDLAKRTTIQNAVHPPTVVRSARGQEYH
jgi:hypothetical protein